MAQVIDYDVFEKIRVDEEKMEELEDEIEMIEEDIRGLESEISDKEEEKWEKEQQLKECRSDATHLDITDFLPTPLKVWGFHLHTYKFPVTVPPEQLTFWPGPKIQSKRLKTVLVDDNNKVVQMWDNIVTLGDLFDYMERR
jgi:hypothetical protein